MHIVAYFLTFGGFLLGLDFILVSAFVIVLGPIQDLLRRNRDDFPKLPKLLARLDKGSRPRGSVIVRIGDDHWREAVRSSLAKIDAVIIDISDVSEAIAWEIREAVTVRDPKALVFIAASDAEPVSALPMEIRAAIHDALGKDLSEVKPVIYPGRRRPSKHECEAFTDKLSEALYDVIEFGRRPPKTTNS